MVSVITAWGIRWAGLPHSPKIDSNHLIKDNWGQYILQQSLKSRVIKREEGGVVVGGCRSSVAEHWRLKPEALGSI